MKVISHIKPRHNDVRNVTIHGTPYAFRRGPDGEFACEVEDPTDLRTFLSSRHFSAAGQPALANPMAPHPSDPPAGANPQGGKGEDDGETPDNSPHVDPLVDTEARELLEGTAPDIGRNIGGVSSLDVIRCAIEIEQAPDGKQRKGVDTMLRQALAAAEQAGVTLS